jgi:hypothetical protein
MAAPLALALPHLPIGANPFASGRAPQRCRQALLWAIEARELHIVNNRQNTVDAQKAAALG